MSNRWISDRKKDYYYRKAKKDNYRSRAAYKLMQVDERFGIFRKGNTVIDLGANPGGWSQVAAELVMPGGAVVAVDIKPLEPMGGVVLIKGDARSKAVKSQVRDRLPGGNADVVISDMAPNISGNYSFDHARSMELAEMALEYSWDFLREGGNLVVKVFDGDMAPEFFARLKKAFRQTSRFNPKASRKSSSEIYMVGKGFKGFKGSRRTPETGDIDSR